MTHEGGCFCGEVRYRAEGAPGRVVHCHCAMCRRASGALFVTWAVFSPERFAWTRGEPRRFASSPEAERTHCADCGTALTFRRSDVPDQIDVTVASLDDPAALPATREIWTASRVSWLHLGDDLPAYPEGSPEAKPPPGD